MVLEQADSWKKTIETEFKQPYMQVLTAFLQAEKEQGKTIYPD
ncbi:MAG: uracil-DNA glycosylase, partial [Gammaproteobacteria bacterium]